MLAPACDEPELATQEAKPDSILVVIRDRLRRRFDEVEERWPCPLRLCFLQLEGL